MLEKHKLTMIYDHAIQIFREDSKTHIHLQSLFGETTILRVMLTIYMFEDHMWGRLQHSKDVITSMTQRWDIKSCDSIDPIYNDKQVTKYQVHG